MNISALPEERLAPLGTSRVRRLGAAAQPSRGPREVTGSEAAEPAC